jgi:short-subunit dehydrogenase
VAVYCATKAAVLALGEALEQELAAGGITVTTIAPAGTRTELLSGIPRSRIGERFAVIEPEDVANAIVRSVAAKRRGFTPVPNTTGYIVKATGTLPTRLRNAMFRALGGDSGLHADAVARRAYLDRVTPG